MRYCIYILVFLPVSAICQHSLVLKKVIKGGLTPKSVVASGTGLFFAQNMMYTHTISVYNRDYSLVKTIRDDVTPSEYGFTGFTEEVKGAPVECAFSHNGKYAWVSNYNMSGKGFTSPGCDSCHGKNYDNSFVYKINTENLLVENIVETGSVPKFLCVTRGDKYLLVSNWSSGDVSIIDLSTEKELKKIPAGRHPRGIVADNKNEFAYVAAMGSNYISRISLSTFECEKFSSPGKGPRHLLISPDDQWLYVSLNSEHRLARINLLSGETEKIAISGMPRSMTFNNDSSVIYLVNYSGNELVKISLNDFSVTETIKTNSHPIGVTCDNSTSQVWVACYSGSIMVFEDTLLKTPTSEPMLAFTGEWTGNSMRELRELNRGITKYEGQMTNDETKKHEVRSKNNEKKSPETKSPENEEVKNIKTDVSKPAATGSGTLNASAGYFVIVGSFKVPENAKKKQRMMKDKGYDCSTFIGNNGMTYAALGGYEQKNPADELLNKVKSQEPGAWILKKE